jgi:hypothetical protein
MHIPTEDKLFEHKCQFKDMKLSAFNPRTLTYYCQICGGKFIIEKDMSCWADLFGEPINLKFSKKVLTKILEEREHQQKKEEEALSLKDEEARKRAEEARKKALESEKELEDERYRKIKEETEKELGTEETEEQKA